MKFKAGDKVRFLNEPGGGVITKIISPSMVNVAIEDGFEIPTLISELILSDKDDGQTEPSPGNIHQESIVPEPLPVQSNDSNTALKISRVRSNQDDGVFLALVPHDQKWLITGLLDLYVINNTKYDLLYNLFLNIEGEIKGIDYGSAEPESKTLIETISREDIDQWRKGMVQLMFHADNPESLLLPVTTEYTIRATQLVRENAYREIPFLEEKAFLLKLVLTMEAEKYRTAEADKKYDQKSETKKKAEEKKEKPLISKHRIAKGEAVVDLHIAELVDNISGLSSKDMLDLQTSYFEKCLNSAIENRYRKVTFIHGVGNGTLKYAISEKIKDYSGLENYDASLAKFGVGAIDIIIKYNENQ